MSSSCSSPWGCRVHQPVKMSTHTTNQRDSKETPTVGWGLPRVFVGLGGAGGVDLGTKIASKYLQVLHHYLNINLTKNSKVGTHEDAEDKAKEVGRRGEGSLSSSVISNLFCLAFILLFDFTLSTSSSFLPINPPATSPPLSSHSPSSGRWSICDPDIHRRRRSSCVWACSVSFTAVYSAQAQCAYACARGIMDCI